LRQIEAGMALNPNPSASNLWARDQSLHVLGRSQEALADRSTGGVRGLMHLNFSGAV